MYNQQDKESAFQTGIFGKIMQFFVHGGGRGCACALKYNTFYWNSNIIIT